MPMAIIIVSIHTVKISYESSLHYMEDERFWKEWKNTNAVLIYKNGKKKEFKKTLFGQFYFVKKYLNIY